MTGPGEASRGAARAASDGAARRQRERDLAACEDLIGHAFLDRSLLEVALTHRSVRDAWTEANERLEFLGDAVIGLVVSEHLFCEQPTAMEGELTRLRSLVVSKDALAGTERARQLRPFLRVGRGIRKTRTIPASLIADAFEALVGAVYLDAGYEAARALILEWLEAPIRKASTRRDITNHKAALQQVSQKLFQATPHYRVLETTGPDHRREFQVQAVIQERGFPPARGASKKQAEQRAAREALRSLKKDHGGDVVGPLEA